MTAREIKERKKYRDSFIVHALLGIAGVALGVYVYKYTGYLSGSADGYIYICRLDAGELFMRYYSELRWLLLLFACGFTLYAVPAAIVFCTGRGFVCSVGILRLAQAVQDGKVGRTHFIITACAMSLVFGIEMIMAVKSSLHGSHLQYLAPKVGDLARDPVTRRYTCAFLLLCTFLFAAVACVYLAPLLPV